MGVGGWATVPSPLGRLCASQSHVTWWASRGSQCPRHDFVLNFFFKKNSNALSSSPLAILYIN